MRNPARIPRIIKKLNQLWKKYPDMRFTQLCINTGIAIDGAIWYAEDDIIEQQIDKILEGGFHK